tara:strand:- start:9478 stop:9795 length:318 start_codon:yes stop_codon:yes gene_type:complete
MRVILYQMRYEDGVYSVGTKNELIKYHNEWVENSGRFELDEIDDNLATTLQDLDEHWIVEQIYQFDVKEVDYLRKVNEILWSYIPESDYELNEKISKEIDEVEAK